VGLAVGDIEKIQVNALIDRYVMQVEQPLNSFHGYNSSRNSNITSKKIPFRAENGQIAHGQT